MAEEVSKKRMHIIGTVAMLMLVCTGLICVAGIQYFGEMKDASQQAAAKEAPRVVTEKPSWHLQLEHVPDQRIFIGFKYADRVYMDVSGLCRQPGFRTHADNESLIKVKDQVDATLVLETPDITLPSQLTESIWWVVSSDAQPEERLLDMPYQWLSYAYGPVNGACLFLGASTGKKIPLELLTDESEPVIGLAGLGVPLGQQLVAHEGSIEVTQTNRVEKLREFPWLLSWLHKFSREGAEQCQSSDGFMPTSKLWPIKVKALRNDQQDTHWLAITGCEFSARWSLVMSNEDGTVSFITALRPPNTEYYLPAKLWTADIDNDGMPEFLIKAQYYEGTRYVLLRLKRSEKSGYYLTEIAGSSYEGI